MRGDEVIEIWFILFLALLFLELITINLVSIWFAIGACAALITASLTDNVMIQITVFILISIIALLVTKPIVKKLRKRQITPTNLDRVIGKIGIVTKQITKNSYGEVKVEGSIWTAKASKRIKEKSQIKVLKIEGVKLLVEEVKEEN